MRWWAIRCGRVLGGDVEREVVAVELVGQRRQLARPACGHVDADDRGAVAVQHPGDLLADAAAAPVTSGDLAGERARPVLPASARPSAGADPDHLARDVRRLGREQEASVEATAPSAPSAT